MSACGGSTSDPTSSPEDPSNPTDSTNVTIEKIEITPSNSEKAVSERQQFGAFAFDQKGNPVSGVSFEWASDNTEVATINSDGLATAKIVGIAQITAKSGNVVGTATLTVTDSPSLVVIPPFQEVANHVAGVSPIDIITEDIDSDVVQDWVVVNFNTSNLMLFYGDGKGNFTEVKELNTGLQPVALVAVDLNNDSKIDLVSVNLGDSTLTSPEGPSLSIFLRDEFKTYTSSSVSLLRGPLFPDPIPLDMVPGDFDGDTNIDLAITDAATLSVLILLGNGNGSFQAPYEIQNVGTPTEMIVADFNGDTSPDLAMVSPSDDSIVILTNTNNGKGTFTIGTVSVSGTKPVALETADINSKDDGEVDLVVINQGDESLSILLGKGDGTFQVPSLTMLDVGSQPGAIATADFNEDGATDLAIANEATATISILFGDGTGVFAPPIPEPARAFPSAIGVADLNNNGFPDLLVTNRDDNSLSVLLNTGNSP